MSDTSSTTPATPTFEVALADAASVANAVADHLGSADQLELRLIGQGECRDGLVYPEWNGVFTAEGAVSSDDLDRADAVLTGLGFAESERDEFAVGPYRLWTDDAGGRAISITVVTDEQLLRINVSGTCATPPDDVADDGSSDS